jgi:hypothetical protein
MPLHLPHFFPGSLLRYHLQVKISGGRHAEYDAYDKMSIRDLPPDPVDL